MENPEDSSPGTSVPSPNVGKPKRAGLIVVGFLMLLALLASAAFVGGRLLNNQPQAGGPGDKQSVSFHIERANELPQTEPNVIGLFADRNDNSIFVMVGGGAFTVQPGKDGIANVQTNGNGQKTEVVVTGETTVYKDITQIPGPDAVPKDGQVQQQVAPGSIDEIGANMLVSVWGERRGERIIATTLLYGRP